MTQKCEQFSYEGFFEICVDFWDPKWSPPPPPPPPTSLASMSKFPSGGKEYENNVLKVFFMNFMKKIKNDTKMIVK